VPPSEREHVSGPPSDLRSARLEAERDTSVPAPPPTFSSASAPLAEESRETALLGAALGLCGLALAGAGVVMRVRRDAGIA
jgi:hypothetical protein